MSRLLAAGLFVVALLDLAQSSLAQQLRDPDAGEDPCRPGELCQSGDGSEGSGEPRVPVADPPGRHTRSLATIGLVAAVVGTYLFYALSGRSLFRRRAPER